MAAFFWVPLTILLMRVMVQMGVARSRNKMLGKQTRMDKARAWLRQYILGG